MKKVKGYLTNDEVFFATKEEAELHEATMDIIAACARLRLRSAAVLRVIHTLSDQIERYINAKRRVTEHPAVNVSSEGDDVSVLELQTRRLEPMSYVWDGERAKEVRHTSAFYGPGSWGDDASGLRSSEDMAAVADSGHEETRGSHSEEDIWPGPMDALHPGIERKGS